MAVSTRIKVEECLEWPQNGPDGNDASAIELVTVTNNAAGALTAGAAVILKGTGCTLDTLSVNTTTNTSDVEVCGMAYEAIAVAAVGRMQIFGPTTVLHADGGTTDIVIGDALTTITPAGRVSSATTAHARMAVALEAYTSTAEISLDAFILIRNLRGW